MPSDNFIPPTPPTSGPRVQLITDAVITAYIHEISPRHRRADDIAPRSFTPPTV